MIHLFTERLSGVRRSGDQFRAKCPVCDSSKPTLSLTERGGRVLTMCFRCGCTHDEVKAALGITSATVLPFDAERRADLERWRAREEARCRVRNERAARAALKRWRQAKPADPEHPYLRRKHVEPLGIRQEVDLLLVPLWGVDGALHGVQEIRPDGRKHFPSGTAKKSHFHVVGNIGGAEAAWIVEGYATAASLHVYRGFRRPVIVAFDAGNMLPVARAVTAAWPSPRWHVLADDDHANTVNAGLMKAQAVVDAGLVQGPVQCPRLTADDRAAGLTDFNDLMVSRGLL